MENIPEGATHFTIGVTTRNVIYFNCTTQEIFTKYGWCGFHMTEDFISGLSPLPQDN